jgi:hypothetical protein
MPRNGQGESVKSLCVSVLTVAVTLAAITPAGTDTYMVGNTQDSGPGTLRWAVNQSNSHIGPDTVLFAIPPSDPGFNPELGVWTINTCGQEIEDDGTFIDGSSQARFAGGDPNPLGPEIEMAGPAMGHGILVGTDDNVVRGLCIHHYNVFAVSVDAPRGELAENNVVAGCYLNVDPTGSHVEVGPQGVVGGIEADSAWGLLIGGDAPEDRNVIAGAVAWDVTVDESGDVQIINNFIGTDRTGTVPLSDANIALDIYGSIGPHLVRDNLIASYTWMTTVFIMNTDPDSGLVTFVHNRVGVPSPGGWTAGEYVTLGHSPRHLLLENTIGEAHGWKGFYLNSGDTDYVTISRNSTYDCQKLGIDLSNPGNETPGQVDYVDGVYGPGVNEEIDPPLCESITSSPEGQGGTTTVYFRCMADCIAEVFVADPNYGQDCSESGYGRVHSGMTYLGDADEVIVGEPWSTYRFSISPALPAGTYVTATATNQNGSTSEFGCTCQVPQMGASDRGCVPTEYRLGPPSPNPCTESTVIRYDIPEPGRVRIAAYDVAGNLAADILDEYRAEGIHALRWDTESPDGTPLPGGLYLLRLVTDGFVASARVVVVR